MGVSHHHGLVVMSHLDKGRAVNLAKSSWMGQYNPKQKQDTKTTKRGNRKKKGRRMKPKPIAPRKPEVLIQEDR